MWNQTGDEITDGYDLNKLALARDAYREGEIGIKDVTDEDWL